MDINRESFNAGPFFSSESARPTVCGISQHLQIRDCIITLRRLNRRELSNLTGPETNPWTGGAFIGNRPDAIQNQRKSRSVESVQGPRV
jgi:hypothetical protein